ncbi:MAG: Nif3-like dinuclear metal center hexameric protein [Anaerolineae bacterium]|nr:Nif3-like dinuclear metal center hexameric protein [Anaerolineae bacterium]
MNTNDIREHLLSRSPWVNRERTVDTVKAGDPTKSIQTVGVGWISSIENLRRAHELGCDLFITHEPTFWEHEAPEMHNRSIEPGLTKQRFLDQTGLVVLRVHDIWDNWPEIGIRDSWARGLGLANFVAEDETRWHAVYAIDETTLAEFAQYVANRVKTLGQDSVQVIGDPEMLVSRPALGVGCGGPDMDMIERGADVLIVCFDGASYWQTRQRFSELGVGVITVEHGTSEMWGLENLAQYLRRTFPSLTTHALDLHARAWTVMANKSSR